MTDLKFFRAVAPRWYGHANDAALAMSALLILAYVASEYLFSDASSDLNITIPITAFVLAIASFVYSLALYRLLARKTHLFAGLLSYLLISGAIGSLIIGTGGLQSQFLALWMIIAVMSYMYGMPVLATMWILTNAYLLVEAMSLTNDNSELSVVVIYFITIQLPFMVSYMLWRRVKEEGLETGDISEFKDRDLGSDLLIESIAEGVIVVDKEGRIQLFNKAAVSTTGWEKTDALKLNYKSIIKLETEKGDPIESSKDPIKIVLTSGKTQVDNALKLRTRSEKSIDVTLVVSPIMNKDKSIKAVVAVFRDVSEERSEERQRAEFISTASHEMRTPVAAIEGYLALAMNEKVAKIDSAAKGYLEKAHASTQSLGKLFQDLLTAAKSEDGRLMNHPVVTNMTLYVEQLVDDLRFTAEKKGLTVIYDYGGSHGGANKVKPIYYAHIDPDRMREVIINLFDNAVKYTEEGKITIGFHGDQEKVTISVTDTGAGIPPEDAEHLFQKFYRVDNSATRQVGGTGLGLFIAKKIVELYHGRIWVESKPEEGSTFFIELPRLDQAKAAQLMQLEKTQNSPLSSIQQTTKL